MNLVRPCDVIISASNPETQLLVVETSPDRLQAGTIVLRSELEVVTLPGTYLPKHLGSVSTIEVWEYERAAKALARALFDEDHARHASFVVDWQNSLRSARTHNPPFTVNG